MTGDQSYPTPTLISCLESMIIAVMIAVVLLLENLSFSAGKYHLGTKPENDGKPCNRS